MPQFQKIKIFQVLQMKIIERVDYQNYLWDVKDTPDIKVITGIRRAGKSEIMKSFVDRLKMNDTSANVVYVDLSVLENESLLEYHHLYEWAKARHKVGMKNYLLIDEVQLCEHFELSINSLHSLGLYDIYLTGSNAFMLSSDLATLFTGRHIEIHVLPFSFKEFYAYYESDTDLQVLFDRYVVEGGLSGSYVYEKERDRKNYVKNVYHTILRRDLTEKYNLPDSKMLEQVTEYMMDNISNTTSSNNVSNCLTANGTITNHATIGSYLKYLCDAFVLYKVSRYDIQGKKYLQTLDKYYLADSGIRFAVLGRRNMDYGRVYENIVALELLRRGFGIYVGKLYQKEVDFVAMRGNEKIYIQVSDDISNPETFQRETDPLLKIRDAYPKMLIARTKHELYDYQGIMVFDLARWLKEGDSVF
ncbi:MAG: ATP-binding protein [Bacteroidales bacterium]|nr:ATP-binding protein [Bacteroidales bacterium]